MTFKVIILPVMTAGPKKLLLLFESLKAIYLNCLNLLYRLIYDLNT